MGIPLTWAKPLPHAQANEVCAVQALMKEIQKLPSGAALELQSASGHYYLDFIGGLTITYRRLGANPEQVARENA